MREEIRQLRGLLENQLAHLAWGELKRNQPLHADVMRRLSRMELDAGLIEKVSAPTVHARDDEHAWKLALTDLAATLPVADHDLLDQGGIVALIGSTGVGKTTSVAKLAARYVLRHGQRHVALVTTDSYRIGAHEQLMTYGRLLGIPVQVASDHKDLRSALNSLADKRLVLIDTAGMSQRDVRLSEQFATLADSGLPIRTLLVLSATAHRSVLDETISAFSDVSLDGAVVTKLDEAASLGSVLSVAIRRHLQLMFVANGQRVPEDLHRARAQDLVQQAAKLALGTELPAESAMAEQFGGFRTNVNV
jgi:flagellar biosynthesis protein FlhF